MHQVLQPVDLSRLPDLLAKGNQVARELGRPILVSLAQPLAHVLDPVRLFSAARRISQIRNFWGRPEDGFWIVGAGVATEIRVDGSDRFAKAIAEHQRIMAPAVVEGPAITEVGPLLIGGFRFDAGGSTNETWQQFPDGLLVLPRWTVVHRDGVNWMTVNVLADGRPYVDELIRELQDQSTWVFEPARDSPAPLESVIVNSGDAAQWRQGVQKVLSAIEEGSLTKATLARTMRVRSLRPLKPEAVLQCLIADYPSCRIFAFCRDDAIFIGATPEELVSLRGHEVRSRCLAGSARRGASPSDDLHLAEALLHSPKERWEHALVADWVSERLGKLCTSLHWNDSPHVVKLSNVQHLSTAFVGTSKPGYQVMDFVAALHPAPAIGGVPLSPALEMIRQLEDVDRGWYSAPVGWVDRSGNGEFGVAIRSALLKGNEALLYAGAGIVKGSDPESEYAETSIKFKPLLSALGAK